MPASTVLQARRALVKLLLALAVAYGVALALTQRASDIDVVAGYRKLAKKVHPDKGGSVQDMQRLQNAKDQWDHARCDASAGRPRTSAGAGAAGPGPQPSAAANQRGSQQGGAHERSAPVLPEAEFQEMADPREATRSFRSWGVLALAFC